MRRVLLYGVGLLCLMGWSGCRTGSAGPVCSAGVRACSYTRMPAYDQTNPNFASYISPATFLKETSPVSNVLPGTCNNPYDQSWLPYGPISGDPEVVCSGWWFTAICCPTAQAMALTAAIESRSPGTTFSGWSRTFFNGERLAPPATGVTNQAGPIFPFVPDPRQHMHERDLQRVIDVALPQGTMPNAGGGENYISSAAVTADFTPAGIGFDGDANTVSNTTFSGDISAGKVVVIAIHSFTAHVSTSGSTSSITFTFNGGGHCLAVKGYNTSPGPVVSLQIIDPVYGVKDWISIINLTTGTFPVGGQTITVTLPSGETSVGVWPDAVNPVSPLSAITDGEQVTFIDEYHTLKVP